MCKGPVAQVTSETVPGPGWPGSPQTRQKVAKGDRGEVVLVTRLRDPGGPPRCRLGSGKQGKGRTVQGGRRALVDKMGQWKGGCREGSTESPGDELGAGAGVGPVAGGGPAPAATRGRGCDVPMVDWVCAPPSPPARAGAGVLAVPCGGHSSASPLGAGGLFRGSKDVEVRGTLPGELLPTRSPVQEAGAGTGHWCEQGRCRENPGGWPADEGPTCCWNPGLCVTFPPSHCSGQFRLFKVHMQPGRCAHGLEHRPKHRRVRVGFLIKGRYLGFRVTPGLGQGSCRRQPVATSQCACLSPPPSPLLSTLKSNGKKHPQVRSNQINGHTCMSFSRSKAIFLTSRGQVNQGLD